MARAGVPPAMDDSAVRFENITCTFVTPGAVDGGFTAVRDTSFAVGKGEFVNGGRIPGRRGGVKAGQCG